MKELKKTAYIILALITVSCANDIHFDLPAGPQGESGKSAYDLWVDAVNNGDVVWNKDETTLADFFKYLKGADGKDGINGVDGINGINGLDGLSAYDLWVIEVKKGIIEDTKNSGKNWDKDKTELVDFWRYLAGADGSDGKKGDAGDPGSEGQCGLSAYELWVLEVKKGIPDPKDPSQFWPMDETELEDFWEYLRGKDGKDGKDGNDGLPGTPGTPGKDVVLIKGVPNVIAQFQNQENNEYVSWTDGSVTYIVYDDAGIPAPSAKVTGMPGIPDEVFISDRNGEFTVPKEKLPTSGTIAERYGSVASVTYLNSQSETETKASAPNTYVPTRMKIRIRLSQCPKINGSNVRVYFVVERQNSPDATWEMIPSYLGDLSQCITAIEVDPDDPSAYDDTSMKWYTSRPNISTVTYIDIPRPTLKCDYMKEAAQPNLWDEKEHYFNLTLNSYYGEKPYSESVIKHAPIQYIPLPENMKGFDYVANLNALSSIEGSFDTSKVDYSLFFKSDFTSDVRLYAGNNRHYTYYESELMPKDEADEKPVFRITFSKSGNDASGNVYNTTFSKLGAPQFSITNYAVYINSSVLLTSQNGMFRGSVEIGTLCGDAANGFKIQGKQNTTYQVNDIPITY